MEEKIRFRIESLQRSKIIMAVEAVAVNTSVMIGIYLVKNYLVPDSLQEKLILAGGLFGIGYAIYASIGNVMRHIEIKKLEKQLQ